MAKHHKDMYDKRTKCNTIDSKEIIQTCGIQDQLYLSYHQKQNKI